ncbi:MAG TPA: hypothetical protein PKW35_03315, partial [Nannocystaceae bacterium]|nr:hypothetical protein [Nannocystaceae bacterium]
LGDAVRSYVATALGEPAQDIGPSDTLLPAAAHPRVISMLCQIIAEARCIAGEPEHALRFFKRAAETVLIDLEWCDRCPVLADMRLLPGFAEHRRLVRERVEAIWAA